jgi:hypothetical protein
MKRLCWMLVLALSACGFSEPKKVDNTATRYADGLVADVQKAKDAADKANRAAAETEKIQREAFESAE